MSLKLAIDVFYDGDTAFAGGLLFRSWTDSTPVRSSVTVHEHCSPYVPDEFFRRELPPILSLLDTFSESVDTILVDGYVWLNDSTTPGLGAHLFDALGQTTPVIGVARNPYQRSSAATEVCRGESEQSLYITSVGVNEDYAAEFVRQMHGPYRTPTLLMLADRLGRDHAVPAQGEWLIPQHV